MKVGKLKKSIGDTSRIVRYMWYAFGGIVVLVVAAFAMIATGGCLSSRLLNLPLSGPCL